MDSVKKFGLMSTQRMSLDMFRRVMWTSQTITTSDVVRRLVPLVKCRVTFDLTFCLALTAGTWCKPPTHVTTYPEVELL